MTTAIYLLAYVLTERYLFKILLNYFLTILIKNHTACNDNDVCTTDICEAISSCDGGCLFTQKSCDDDIPVSFFSLSHFFKKLRNFF